MHTRPLGPFMRTRSELQLDMEGSNVKAEWLQLFAFSQMAQFSLVQ